MSGGPHKLETQPAGAAGFHSARCGSGPAGIGFSVGSPSRVISANEVEHGAAHCTVTFRPPRSCCQYTGQVPQRARICGNYGARLAGRGEYCSRGVRDTELDYYTEARGAGAHRASTARGSTCRRRRAPRTAARRPAAKPRPRQAAVERLRTEIGKVRKRGGGDGGDGGGGGGGGGGKEPEKALPEEEAALN